MVVRYRGLTSTALTRTICCPCPVEAVSSAGCFQRRDTARARFRPTWRPVARYLARVRAFQRLASRRVRNSVSCEVNSYIASTFDRTYILHAGEESFATSPTPPGVAGESCGH